MGKKKSLKIIIIAVSALALIGIAAIQYYYVHTAIDASEATFDRNVNDVMSRVVFQIEKNEIALQVRKKLKTFSREQQLVNTLDSLNQELFRSLKKIGVDSMRTDSIIQNTRNQISQRLALNEYGNYLRNIDTTKAEMKIEVPVSDSIMRMEFPYALEKRHMAEMARKENQTAEDRKMAALYSNVDQFLHRAYLVGDVMEDFFNINHFFPIESRVDSANIDSLIRTELSAHGIDAEFVFAVYSPTRDTLMMYDNRVEKQSLVKSKYSFRLFPSDMFSSPDYLKIYFPHKNRYLYSDVSGMLMLTLFLVAVIASSFFFILFNLLQQKRLSEMKTDFINNMTHEIKTPISTISLACEMMSDKTTTIDQQQKDAFISVIAQENKRLAAMTDKILQTAIIERGQMKLKQERTDIHELIRRSVNNTILWVNQKNGKIDLNLDAEHHFSEVDPVHFENVIFNLLDNAIKYSPKEPHIVVSTENTNGYLVIKVKDNGIGIEKKELKKIFESLYRVPTGNIHNVKGFGLGLCYVKAIVASHNGHISVDSEVGKGTTFTILIDALNEKQ